MPAHFLAMASEHGSLNIENVIHAEAISQIRGTRNRKLLNIELLIHLTPEKFQFLGGGGKCVE